MTSRVRRRGAGSAARAHLGEHSRVPPSSVHRVDGTPTRVAQRLFAPLAPGYERWARVLSLGQDARWRHAMVDRLEFDTGASVLDIAAGTGSITRLLVERGARVVSLDQSLPMLVAAVKRGATGVVATAERLPFGDASFDAVPSGISCVTSTTSRDVWLRSPVSFVPAAVWQWLSSVGPAGCGDRCGGVTRVSCFLSRA